jgi:6-phosphogluconolactonase/glucosamine-6-phosphate isomerase/deaminase
MQFLRGNQAVATDAIATRISTELSAGKRVLWLVSGGSNIAIEVAVMTRVREQVNDRLSGLAIMPMDERYGKPGHSDSNSEALRQAGFEPGTATWVDILTHNVSFDQTIDFFNDVAATALANASVVIGQFGMGADGHIAGILPGSPAAVADEATVAGYEWSDYTRLTLTPRALLQVNTAYVPAFGDGKQAALVRLQEHTELLATLPAVLLYQIPDTYVYNDYITTEE